MSVDARVLRLFAPLDAARSRALRAWRRPLAPLVRDRALRTTALTSLSVVVALALTLTMPLVVLAVGPILLGVPHLVADVRYLVVRRGLHARRAVVALTMLPLALALVIPTLELAGVVTLGAAVCARALAPWRRALAGALGLALLGVGLRTGRAADVVFAHAHNAIAIGIWWWMRPRTRAFEALVPVLALVGALVVLAAPVSTERFGAFASVLPLPALVATLALPDAPALALRLVLLFAFGQAVHYAIWLRAMPEDCRARPTPRTFAASYRALRDELGAGTVLACALVTLTLVGWAAFDLASARDAYLGLALFHGPLEIGLVSLAFVEGRRP